MNIYRVFGYILFVKLYIYFYSQALTVDIRLDHILRKTLIVAYINAAYRKIAVFKLSLYERNAQVIAKVVNSQSYYNLVWSYKC